MRAEQADGSTVAMKNHSLPVAEEIEDRIGELAEEFSQRLKAGEAPTVEEYAQRYPSMADVIRQVFPALEVMGEPSIDSLASEAGKTEDKRGLLGDYRILREIGRGGMGVVYEAEQISLSRRVALKILPFAAALDERHIKRFRNEALAAAQLDHPHIVDVYGVGCERSVHFYAMRFIDGATLANVIQQLQKASLLDPTPAPVDMSAWSETVLFLQGKGNGIPDGAEHSAPGNQNGDVLPDILPETADTSPVAAFSTQNLAANGEYFRSIAQIGVDVAEALDHAHQQGVVHRDIKPGNIMIDAQGKSWVTDFGLAHVETEASLTMSGDLLGTLRYMSPEQALAKRIVVDHRSDIYSFGVTLYELLTLQPAFPGNDRQELMRQIAFEEPVAPRKINRIIPADLETIVLKAASKNPTERYETAQELADDLRRFLNDEPIRAKPPTVTQRLSKWTRRHVTGVLVCTGILLFLSLTLGISIFFINAERNEKQTALEERDRALGETNRALQAADENLQTATEVIGHMLTEVGRREPEQVPGMEVVQLQTMLDAVDFYRKLVKEKPRDARLKFLLISSLKKLQLKQAVLDRQASAIQTAREAAELSKKLADSFPQNLRYQAQHAECLGELGFRLNNSDVDQAVEVMQASHRLWKDLHQKAPERFEKRLAKNETLLAYVLCHQKNYDQAQVHLERSLSILMTRFSEARHSWWHPAVNLQKQALIAQKRGDLENAIKHLKEAQEIAEQANPENEHKTKEAIDFFRALTDITLANIHDSSGHRDKAVNDCRRAFATLLELRDDYPTVPRYENHFLRASNLLKRLLEPTEDSRGIGRDATGRTKQQLSQSRRSVAHWREIVKQKPSERYHHLFLAQSLRKLAENAGQFGDDAGATRHLNEAVEILEKLLEFWPDEKQFQLELGHCYRIWAFREQRHHRFESAEDYFQKSFAHYEATQEAELLSWAMLKYAELLAEENRLDDASTVYREILNLTDRVRIEQFGPVFPARVTTSQISLGEILYHEGDPEHAKDLWKQALADRSLAHVQYRIRIPEPGRYRLYLRATTENSSPATMFVRLKELSDGPAGKIADWYSVQVVSRDRGAREKTSRLPFGCQGTFEGRKKDHLPEPMEWTVESPGELTLEIEGYHSGVGWDLLSLQRADLPAPMDELVISSNDEPAEIFELQQGRVLIRAVDFSHRQSHRYKNRAWMIVPTEEAVDEEFRNEFPAEYLHLLPNDPMINEGYTEVGKRPPSISYSSQTTSRIEQRLVENPHDPLWWEARLAALKKVEDPNQKLSDLNQVIDRLQNHVENTHVDQALRKCLRKALRLRAGNFAHDGNEATGCRNRQRIPNKPLVAPRRH